MLDLNKFAQEVHAVSVEHGWWEGEENNDVDTKIALIHAEWSEALEEYRDGRPMVWYKCREGGEVAPVCVENACVAWMNEGCDICSRDNKPEGIAVELVDGVIRILDLMTAKEMDFAQAGYICGGKCTLPQLVAVLHYATAMSGPEDDDAASWLISCIEAVCEWLEERDVDMDEILRLKHEYNKTRPYRHGGKRC